MKTCFKCLIKKPVDEFYRHTKMLDGRLNKCKECTKKDVSENYRNNIDHYKKYERERALLPHRVSARDAYAKTENGKERGLFAKKKWLSDYFNQIKRASHVIVNNAVRDGRLSKPKNCSKCDKTECRIEGHHDDYARPLDVRWLCSKCHRDFHKENIEFKFSAT